MKANFKKALAFVLEVEGGFSDDPDDPGGATNYGISQRFLDQLGCLLVAEDLTQSQAEQLYKDYFWDAVKGDDLPDGLDMVMFDAAVNSGPTQATKWLQRSLKVAADGVIGPVTLAHIASAKDRELILDTLSHRCVFYAGLNKPKYLRGWLKRSLRLAVESNA